MKKQIGDYRYLAGSARTRGTLWEGPDHLLYLDRSGFGAGYSETIRRIDYSKIQCITYGRSRTGWWITACLTLLMLVFGWSAWNMNANPGGQVVVSMISLLFLVLLIVHLVKGPTCVCKVTTAVQVLRLKPLRRISQSRRFVERLKELCLQHQGGSNLTQEQHLLAVESGTNSAQSLPDQNRIGGMKPPFAGSVVLKWALLLMVVAGALRATEPFIDNLAFFITDVILSFGAGALLLIGLVRNLRFQMVGALKGTLWASVVNFLLGAALGYGVWIFANVKSTAEKTAQGRMAFAADFGTFRWLSHAGYEELGWVMWFVVGTGVAATILALFALPMVMRPGATAGAIAAPPPLPRKDSPEASEIPEP